MKEEIMTKKTMDCMGISCPKPLIRLSKAVRELSTGDQIEVFASDPNFQLDINAWAQRTGHAILSVDQEDDRVTVLIKVA
jgi:tRNA 2-thiouridine synthesizing protein A